MIYNDNDNYNYNEDTIAAISTPLGEGGIGIVRLSGRRAIEIVDRIFISPHGISLRNVPSHTIHYGFIQNEGMKIDEVLVSVMRAPKTYTREDVVEINCHGGIVPLRKVLELVLEKGARYAQPGEFTKRAFLNGRLSLDQAEAVLDIIRSKTELSLQFNLERLLGKFSKPIKELKEQLIDILARIEVAIDFPDYEEETLNREELAESLIEFSNLLEYFLERGKDGKIFKEGLAVAIIGKPNVGKSTLLNELLQENRAIVTPIPGTTRDIIEEELEIKGVPFRIIDTAGLRQSIDEIERISIERTLAAAERADLILFMIDASAPLTEEDLAIAKCIKNKRSLLLLNKVDLGKSFSKGEAAVKLGYSEENALEIAAKYSLGLEDLKEKMVELVWGGKLQQKEDVFLLNVREKDLLQRAQISLQEALTALKNGATWDLLAIDLKEALNTLGELTGENLTEEVIDRIFANFCIGK